MAVPAPQRQPLIDAIGILKESWELFSKQWQAWLVIGIVYAALAIVAAMTCIGIVIVPALGAGLYIAAFKQMRGQVPEVRDLFEGFQVFGGMFLVHLITGICIVLGLCLCIVPGLVLAVWWAFAVPIMLEQKIGATDAMAVSKAKVTQGFWDIVVLLLLIAAVNFVTGMVPFGQILVGLPIQTIMIAVAYRDLFGLAGALPPVGRGPAPGYQPPLQQQMGTVGCARCGSANVSGTKFCTACGTPLV